MQAAQPQAGLSSTTDDNSTYIAFPWIPTPQRAAIGSRILRGICAQETLFTDYQRGCDTNCMECESCQSRMTRVARKLTAPDTRVWEVWNETDIVGILYLTDIIAGGDAKAHYIFFDGELRSKTGVIEQIIEWVFTDHPDEGWLALTRLTVEIPSYAFALARHASKFLQFGGPFMYRAKAGKSIPVEGVKSGALRWRSKLCDLLILGRMNTNG